MISKQPNTLLNKLTSYGFTVFSSRRSAVASLLSGSVFVGSVIYASNTVALAWAQSLVLAEVEGRPIVPSTKLRRLCQTAANDLKLSDAEKATVKFFCTDSGLVESLGSVKSQYGARIGLPEYLNADSAEKVIVTQSLYRPLTEKEKQMLVELKDSSVFSDSAKLYAISEGLATVKDYYHFVVPAITSSLCFMSGCIQAAMFVKFSSFKQLPVGLRFPAYLISVLMWTLIAFKITDHYQNYCFNQMLAGLNERCVDAGIAFYEQVLKRHKISNDLFGHSFCDIGNHYLSILVTRRLSALRNRKEEYSV